LRALFIGDQGEVNGPLFDANANGRWRARESVAPAYRPSDPSISEDEEHAKACSEQSLSVRH